MPTLSLYLKELTGLVIELYAQSFSVKIHDTN